MEEMTKEEMQRFLNREAEKGSTDFRSSEKGLTKQSARKYARGASEDPPHS